MVALSAAYPSGQSVATDREKENFDHGVTSRKSAKASDVPSETGRHPLAGLLLRDQSERQLTKPSCAAAPVVFNDVRMSTSPELLTPVGASTPVISPHLKELSSSPVSAQATPISKPNIRNKQDGALSVNTVKGRASASPDGAAAILVDTAESGPPPAHLRNGTTARSLLRLRVRRALTLQAQSGAFTQQSRLACSRQNVCSKSVGSLNLSGARLQSAARNNLSRSADWPVSSAACIRKRMEEGTGYEVPNKTLKHDEQSLLSAADSMAQMRL